MPKNMMWVLFNAPPIKKGVKAKRFYEKNGFEATHEGMKLYLKK